MGLLKRLSIPLSALLAPLGEVDPLAANMNLADIRRPGFLAQAPHAERIAAADGRAFTCEFTPRQTSCGAGTRAAVASASVAARHHGQPIHPGVLHPANLPDIAVEHLLGAR